MAVSRAMEQLGDLLAIVWDQPPWPEKVQCMDLLNGLRAYGDLQTLHALHVDSPKGMRGFMNMTDVKDDFYCTRNVFVKIQNCHLLFFIVVFFGAFRLYGPHLH